jgi:hypothetical protein
VPFAFTSDEVWQVAESTDVGWTRDDYGIDTKYHRLLLAFDWHMIYELENDCCKKPCGVLNGLQGEIETIGTLYCGQSYHLLPKRPSLSMVVSGAIVIGQYASPRATPSRSTTQPSVAAHRSIGRPIAERAVLLCRRPLPVRLGLHLERYHAAIGDLAVLDP